MKLEKVNFAQKVVIAQLHVKDDDSPPIKVFWNKGKITVGFRVDFNQTSTSSSTVLSDVPLGARFDITIEVTKAGACTVSASCNGRSGTTPALQLSATWATQTLNFHGGVYNQVDYTDDTPADDGSVCAISLLELSHA
ncbi:Alginate lyase [compost metagenome]